MRASLGGVALLSALALAGCDTEDGASSTPISDGERVFSSPLPDGNTFTCSTCHAIDEPASDGLRRPGHALAGATQRATFKNGQLDDLLLAVNSCQVEWMNAEPWGPDDPDWLALFEFLDGTSDDGTEVQFEIVAPPEDLAGGDATRGLETFNNSCVVCHARDGIGSQLAPSVAQRGLDADLIARRVRTSGRAESSVYDGLTGGVMPFWAADRLSDDELRDIIAWIESTGDPVAGGGGGGGPSDDTRGCGVTHPLVGATAQLQGFSHGVAGTATILDDCTIQITDFVFDGGGIDVRVYGGLGGDYDNGFAIGPDLTRSTVYDGETITVQLDPSQSLDDLDGISIWCVPVGVDFGSGPFER
ncbi:MAG: DM13 domain-containing protein [Myxococcota bacterium]